MPKENRAVFEMAEVRVSRDEDTGKTTVSGYAAVFEQLSLPIMGVFREKVQAGAFAGSLAKNNIRALWNHNSDMVLGSTKSGTLSLEEDTRGLRFELELPDTQTGRDAGVLIERGDVEGVSFGFRVKGQVWDESDPDNIIRTLTEVDLAEISPTAFPAYPQTSVKTRSIKEEYDEFRGEKEKNNTQLGENELNLKLRLSQL